MVGILEFQRPKQGACRDLKELEYIQALHQSCEDLRVDGAISPECICRAILSRHGIEVSSEHLVSSGIFADLAGDGLRAGAPPQHLGLAQLVALLVSPKLKRMAEAQETKSISTPSDSDADHEAIEIVLQLLRRQLGMSEMDPPPPINEELLLCLFSESNEEESEQEHSPVCSLKLKQMLEYAGEGAVLDAPTLLNLMTKDLTAYNTAWETSRTTHSDDFLDMIDGGLAQLMMGCSGSKCPVATADKDTETADPLSCTMTRLAGPKILSTIDLTADTFKSDIYFIFLFLSMILAYLAFFTDSSLVSSARPCGDSFGCDVAMAVSNWLFLFVQLGVMGSSYVFFCSGGNDAFKKCPLKANIMAIVILVIFTILPFSGITEPLTAITEADYLQIVIYGTVLAGAILVGLQILSVAEHFMPKLRQFMHGRSMIVRKEMLTKSAESYKVNRLLEHALELHREATSGLDQNRSSSLQLDESNYSAMVIFQSKYNEMETVGGYWWTWEAWKTGQCSKEGIWWGARFLAAHFAQFVAVVIFFSLVVVSLRSLRGSSDDSSLSFGSSGSSGPRSLYFNASGSFLFSADQVDEEILAQNQLQFGYTFDEDDSQMTMYQQTQKERLLSSLLVAFSYAQETSTLLGFEAAEDLFDNLASTIKRVAGIDLEDLAGYVEAYARFDGSIVEFVVEEGKKLVPQKDIETALWFGGAMGMVSILSSTLVFFPSYICQTLQYRYGAKGNLLTAPFFRMQRSQPWLAPGLFGMVFWSSLTSAVVVASVFGGVLFLFIWEETSPYLLALLATGIGLISTWILKKIVLVYLKKRSFAGFYRTNVGLSNFVTIFLEAWHVGLTLGFVTGRAIKMILMTCVYIGRIDTSYLAGHVNFFGLQIDEEYQAFHIDILLHEAHRHPYLERLIMLYMVKIYHGKSFVTREGSCWRILFVTSLMPWLRRRYSSASVTAQTLPPSDSDQAVSEQPLEA